MTPIYLDHNATTPLLPEVADALDRALREGWANPASQHAAGRRARRFVEDARERIGELLGADVGATRPDRVVFTSGGTEANNLALLGLTTNHEPRTKNCLLISAIEHPSILGPAAKLATLGWNVDKIAVDQAGRIDLAALESQLRPEVALVSIMLGNNETGVVQPVAAAAALCRARGVLIHTDAVQAVGKIGVDFTALNVDALSLAAHKFHGLVGIGALIVRRGVPIEPLLVGGFQQEGLRPGTESPALVAGLLAALEAWAREGASRTARLAALRNDLEARIMAACPEVVVQSRDVERLPQTSNIAFVGVNRQTLLIALDQVGVACSTGSACASGSSEPSPVLSAMGVSAAELESSLRFSVGCTTTAAEIASAAERICRIFHELRRRKEPEKMGSGGRSKDRTPV
jgi:cysteine desulfurase